MTRSFPSLADGFRPSPVIRTVVLVAIALLSPPGAARAAEAKDTACLQCHGNPTLKRASGAPLVVDAGGMAASLHGKAHIACVDCHVDLADSEPSQSRPHAKKLATVNCAECHDGMGPKHRFHPQMIDKPDQVTCQECHGTHDVLATKSPDFKFSGAHETAACGVCHELMRDEFIESEHARAAKAGLAEAPDCIKCHQTALVTTPKGEKPVVLRQNQARLCLSCHLDNSAVRARIAPSTGFIAAFEKSVHGRALAAGNGKAPACSGCHGSHAIKKSRDSTAPVNRANIAETCAECHASVARKFRDSTHGVAVAKGSVDAPTCTTCHGEHEILKHDDPRAAVSAGNVSQKVCGPCHASVKLTRKYGINADRFQTFSDSYHGLAMRGGDVEVANCASCHGVHDIKPSSDPRSRIHPSHLADTCGKCHSGANRNFAAGAVHVTMARGNEPALYWLSTLYLILIVTVVSGMFGHNLLDFVKRTRRLFASRRGDLPDHPPDAPVAHRLYVRMTLAERWQHAALALSFMALVFTGFLLRYPDAWWVVLIKAAWSGLFSLRGLIHRVAAVVMLTACAFHIGYLAFTTRGRALIRDLRPRWQDGADAVAVLAYNLGMRRDKPRFGRFSYIEKVEYWALIWGTIVMAVTGLIMWFDNSSMRVLSKYGYDIARLIHFFEAWLASLSILVWHLYFVAFNPDSYPMSLTWLTGKVSEHEMAEEHPLELARLKDAEAAATKAAAPKPGGDPDDGHGGAG